jgi:hypothetical protein
MVMTGHLSVVAYGPPCLGDRWGSGHHCGVAWTLWGSPGHAREFEDMISGDFVMLTGSSLPPLINPLDVDAAQALGDVIVTIRAVAPDYFCSPDYDEIVRRPCTVPLSQIPIAVDEICRS